MSRFTNPAADTTERQAGVRIGDAERDRAADSLGAHFRAGRLDPHEYAERVDVAYRARTERDLAPLFADLPGGVPRIGAPDGDRHHVARRRPVLGFGRAVVFLILVAAAAMAVSAHVPLIVLVPLLWFTVVRRGFAHPRGPGRGGRQRI